MWRQDFMHSTWAWEPRYLNPAIHENEAGGSQIQVLPGQGQLGQLSKTKTKNKE